MNDYHFIGHKGCCDFDSYGNEYGCESYSCRNEQRKCDHHCECHCKCKSHSHKKVHCECEYLLMSRIIKAFSSPSHEKDRCECKSCSHRKEHSHCDSHSHKKEEKEHCEHDKGHNKKSVKDCICIDWSVPDDATQTVYRSHRVGGLTASGFVSYDCGSPDYIVVKFFCGNHEVDRIKVFRESSTAFTVNNFNRITIQSPPEFDGTPDADCPNGCEGELCITPRFSIS